MAQVSKLNAQFEGNQAFEGGKERARAYLRIGSELRRLRMSQGLSQEEIALKTGLDQADISRLETGKWGSRGISFDVLGRLLPAFGLRIAHEVRPAADAVRLNRVQLHSAELITDLLHAEL